MLVANVQKVRIVFGRRRPPETRVRQDAAVARVAALVGNRQAVRGPGARQPNREPCSILPPEQIEALGSIEERNAIYETEAPRLAQYAAEALRTDFGEVSFLVKSSCTGCMVPGLDVDLASRLELNPRTGRLPSLRRGAPAASWHWPGALNDYSRDLRRRWLLRWSSVRWHSIQTHRKATSRRR